MVEDKDVQIQVGSGYFCHSIDVLRLRPRGPKLGVGGEENSVELLRFLGYTVDHEAL